MTTLWAFPFAFTLWVTGFGTFMAAKWRARAAFFVGGALGIGGGFAWMAAILDRL